MDMLLSQRVGSWVQNRLVRCQTQEYALIDQQLLGFQSRFNALETRKVYGMQLAPQFLTPADVNALPSRAADQRLAYGADPLQLGDLRLPATAGPHPVAIVIHGGCWLTGFADMRYSAALSDTLRDTGVATWNLEYRRADYPGGGWTGTFDDVADAVDHLRLLAPSHSLDLARVIAIGHSAGGTLALWAAARCRLAAESPLYRANPLELRGVLVLGGPGDLRAFARIDCDICGSPVVARLLGGAAAEVPQHYAQASPIEMLPLGVRQILITGEHDAAVPQELGDAYVVAACQAGDDARHIVVPGAAHHEYCSPCAATWPFVLQAARTLIGSAA